MSMTGRLLRASLIMPGTMAAKVANMQGQRRKLAGRLPLAPRGPAVLDRRFPRSENTPQSLERDTPFSRQFGLFRQILVGDFWIPCLVLATSIRTTLGRVLLGEPSFRT